VKRVVLDMPLAKLKIVEIPDGVERYMVPRLLRTKAVLHILEPPPVEETRFAEDVYKPTGEYMACGGKWGRLEVWRIDGMKS
jgi:hypothetical protein